MSGDANGQVRYMRNTAGDGSSWDTFTMDNTERIVYSIAAGDISGDGNKDGVAGTSNTKRFTFIDTSGGLGSSWSSDLASVAGTVYGVGMDDMDGDGDIDIVTVDSSGLVLCRLNNDGAGGSWIDVTVMNSGGRIFTSLDIGDIDGDGDLDIVTGDKTDDVYAHINSAGDASSWSSVEAFDTNKDINAVSIGDLDGDGDADIAAGGVNKKVRFLANTNGAGTTWSSSILATTSSTIYSIDIADVDDDGDQDVVSGDRSNNVILHDNIGGGSWDHIAVYTSSSFVRIVRVSDVDGDGDGDIFSAGDDNKLTLVKNDGSWTSSTVWSTSNTIYSIAPARSV